jgi:hypothetical protein
LKNHLKIADQTIKLAAKKGVIPAVESILKKYKILAANVELALKPNDAKNQLVLTTEGEFGQNLTQIVRVPENIFEFPMEMVVNLLAHEMIHINQKTGEGPVLDKNEREFQAYYEGVFPEIFLELPPCPDWLKKQLANQAIRYFNQMVDGTELKAKYFEKKTNLEAYLASQV